MGEEIPNNLSTLESDEKRFSRCNLNTAATNEDKNIQIDIEKRRESSLSKIELSEDSSESQFLSEK